MQRFYRTVLSAIVFAGLSFSSFHGANADLILGLQSASPLTVNDGGTVFVDMFISDSDASTPLAAEGLFAAGGRILQTAGLATATVGAITDEMNYWTGGAFVTNPVSDGGGTEVAKVSTLRALAAVTGAGAGNTSITIARFSLQISGIAGSTIQLTADRLRLAPENTNTTFGVPDLDFVDPDTSIDGLELDNLLGANALSFGSLTFTVAGGTPVPEPASMILASLTAVAAGGGSYLRRKKSKLSGAVKV
jgi:hypothetical protein